MLYSPSVMDTYMDTWPMEPTFIAARTRPSIAGLRLSSRVKCITLPLQIMDSVGRMEFFVWTGGSRLRSAGPRAPLLDEFRLHPEWAEFLFPGRLLDGRE